MNLGGLHTALTSAALGAHRRAHGGVRFIALIIIVALVVYAVVKLVGRSKERRGLSLAMSDASASPTSTRAPAVTTTGVAIGAPARAADPGTVTTRTRGSKQFPPGRYGISGLLRSEWTKLRTVRSTMWTLGVTVVLGIGIGALTTGETRAHWSTMSLGNQLTFDPIATSLVGLFVGQFAIGILGALVVSAEYGTGTIRATFSAAPRRPTVLVAKALVFGVVALVVAEVVSFISFFLGQALLSSPAIHATLSTPGAVRAVVGGGLYICALGLFALGLASIIRHTAGAISAYIGILLVLPLVLQALPTSILNDVRRFLPDRIGATMISQTPVSNTFSPWVGLLVLCIYAAVALIVGAVLLIRRDA